MMKKGFSIIIGILSVVMMSAVFVGCGAKKDFFTFASNDEDYAKSATILTNSGTGATNLTSKNNKYWKADKGDSVTVDLGTERKINTITLREKNDNVVTFRLSVSRDNANYDMIYEQDRIGSFRVCALEDVTVRYIKLDIADTIGKVELRDMGIYFLDKRTEDFRVSGYLSHNEDFFESRIGDPGFSGYFDVITDVISISSVSINSSGELVFAFGEEKFANDMRLLKEIIGERDVKIWICIFFRMGDPNVNGGNDKNQIKDFINKNIESLTQTLFDFAVKYDVYGIDYDWEYPNKASQWKAYDLMINKLYEKLEPVGKKISLALPPWGVGLSKQSIRNIDHVNLMCYDLFDERRDHASFSYAGSNALKYMNSKGYPKEKVWLGPPFYGRNGKDSDFDWPNYSSFYNPETNTSSISKFDNCATRDKIYNNQNDTRPGLAYFDGYTEICDKTAMALALGHGGMMVFSLNCDTPYTFEYSLTRGIGKTISQRCE